MALCPRCSVRLVWRHGLCADCGKGIAAKCLDCGKRAQFRRGLCGACYADGATRERYGDRRAFNGAADDSTEAELDALIAERMRPENLPAWWPKDGRKDVDPEGDE